MLEALYSIQKHLLEEMPEIGTSTREALDELDRLIDELESERG